MRGIDTNVLVRFLTQDDARQARKVDRLIAEVRSQGETLYVNAIVLCEVVWVLRSAYRYERARIVDAMELLLAVPDLVVEDADLARQALAAYRRGPGDFSDYFIGARNEHAGCDTTATFDARLGRAEAFTRL